MKAPESDIAHVSRFNCQTGHCDRTSRMTKLGWLVRYANYCGFRTGDPDFMLQSLRSAFGPPAWRIVCRSPKACFIPILRNRDLTIQSLIQYCTLLAEHSFVIAPKPILLNYFVRQRRLYFDRSSQIPRHEDFNLIRVANRQDELSLRDIACVANWSHQSRTCIQTSHRWKNLVARARKYNEKERIQLTTDRSVQWHFFCRTTEWRGYEVQPLIDAASLWREGQRHSNCLYRLRFDCGATLPSRFFKISKNGRSIATLEIVWRSPRFEFSGMDRVWGRWELQDLRLSYNRLPDQRLVEAMQAFSEQYNIWAKRVGRMPDGYIDETIERIARAKRLEAWQVFTSDGQ